MNKNLKRGAIVAAGAATVLSLVVATPSFAHQRSNSTASTATSTARVAHVHATAAVTITGVPATVTDSKLIARGAKFVAYALAADATAIPAAQPTTGGKPVRVEAVKAADGTVTYQAKLPAGAAGSATNYAIYNAAGVGTFVTVTVAADGTTVTASVNSLTTNYVEPTAPAYGEGKGIKSKSEGRHGHKGKRR